MPARWWDRWESARRRMRLLSSDSLLTPEGGLQLANSAGANVEGSASERSRIGCLRDMPYGAANSAVRDGQCRKGMNYAANGIFFPIAASVWRDMRQCGTGGAERGRRVPRLPGADSPAKGNAARRVAGSRGARERWAQAPDNSVATELGFAREGRKNVPLLRGCCPGASGSGGNRYLFPFIEVLNARSACLNVRESRRWRI